MANGEPTQPGTAGPTNQMNPNAPVLDLSPSLMQAGITMIASGLADDGTITPGSAQALHQLGQGIAYRMQDRWWKQEFENFQSTKGAEIRMQSQRTTQEYNLKLQEAGKIADPFMRMQAMNETHGWAVEQMGTLDQQYLDAAATFPNNPYIGQQAGRLLEQRRQQWQQLAAGPQQAAETVSAQEQGITAAGQRDVQAAQIKQAETGVALDTERVQTEKAQQELLRAQAGYYGEKAGTTGLTAFDKIMPSVINAKSPEEKLGLIYGIKGGKEKYEGLLQNRRNEMEQEFATDVANINKRRAEMEKLQEAGNTEEATRIAAALKLDEETFRDKYDMFHDEATDKEGKAAFEKFIQRNSSQLRDTVLQDMEASWQSQFGQVSPRVPQIGGAGRGPTVLRPGQKAGGIEYVEPPGEFQPTAAARAWGVTSGTTEQAGQKAIDINANVQNYFARQGIDAPAPFDVTVMDQVLAETGKTYEELAAPKGKPLPPKEREAKVKQLAEKAKAVLQTPDEAENRDYRINKGLLHLTNQYIKATGRSVTVDQFMEEALGIAALKPEDIKARAKVLRDEIQEINNLLVDPSMLEPGQSAKLNRLRTQKLDQLDAMGEPSTPIRGLMKKFSAAQAEQERQKAKKQASLKRLMAEE